MVPIAFAVVCILVLVQALGVVPSVRAAMDRAEGRFVAVQASAQPPSLQNVSGAITLTLDSPDQASHIVVYRNGVSLGTFTTNQMGVLLHNGDTITFRDTTPNGPQVAIYVTNDNQNLLLPASGQTAWLGNGVATASLGKTEFM